MSLESILEGGNLCLEFCDGREDGQFEEIQGGLCDGSLESIGGERSSQKGGQVLGYENKWFL